MDDYISREQLLNRIAAQKCDGRTSTCKDCDTKSFCVYGVVEAFPAADVAPVRHGEWMDAYGDSSNANCSLCGNQVVVFQEDSPNIGAEMRKSTFREFQKFCRYCIRCGAKMDGGSE